VIFINRFFHPDHSATSQILSDLAFHLARQGHNVFVITSRLRYDGSSERLPARENLDGVTIRRVWTSWFGRSSLAGRGLDYFTFYVCACLAVLTLVRSHDVVVAMTDPPLIGVPVSWIARLRGARIVNWLQDLFPEVGQALGLGVLAGAPGDALKCLRDRSLRRADRNVVLGSLMAERLAALGVSREQIAIIANWADDEAIQPIEPDDNPLREAWQLYDKFVIGYSGNLGRAHDYETLLKAAERLADRDDIVFLFIGGGHHHQRLKTRVREAGDDRFRFLEYQERAMLAQSLGACDIHWTSLNPALEGLIVPSKLYGIAAAGRPIIHIGHPDGEIGKAITAHRCGVVVKEGDGDALASAIATMADHPSRRAEMGANARAMLESQFTRRQSLGAWSALLSKL